MLNGYKGSDSPINEMTRVQVRQTNQFYPLIIDSAGEESLTIFLNKQKLNKKSEGSSNSSVVSLELLHQLAASYFTDRESTLRRLHHLQIATAAIKVPYRR